MARRFLSGIDLALTQAMNMALQSFTGTPTTQAGIAGQVGYFPSLGYTATYNGASGAWVPHDASRLVGAIPMAALTVDPTQRANHSGSQLAGTISNLQSTVQGYSLSAFAAPSANIAMAGFTLTGLSAATGAGQPLEYAQGVALMQSTAAGISSKDPVMVLASSNITLSGLQTIDGVTVAAGQRVLAVGQATASQNGAYVAASGAWSRVSTEGNGLGELDPGAQWLVLSGTVYAGTQWRLSTTGTITVGTTSISIVQSAAAAVYGAGNGLSLAGNSFTVTPVASGGIVVSSAGVAVDTTIVARKYSATIGDGSSTTYTVNHNLGTRDVQVQVYQTASPYATVEVDVNRTDANNVSVVFAAAPATGSYRVVVIG